MVHTDPSRDQPVPRTSKRGSLHQTQGSPGASAGDFWITRPKRRSFTPRSALPAWVVFDDGQAERLHLGDQCTQVPFVVEPRAVVRQLFVTHESGDCLVVHFAGPLVIGPVQDRVSQRGSDSLLCRSASGVRSSCRARRSPLRPRSGRCAGLRRAGRGSVALLNLGTKDPPAGSYPSVYMLYDWLRPVRLGSPRRRRARRRLRPGGRPAGRPRLRGRGRARCCGPPAACATSGSGGGSHPSPACCCKEH